MSWKKRKNKLVARFMADGFDGQSIKVFRFKENPMDPGEERLGLVAEHKTARNHATKQPKKAYYVEGSPYEMGFLLGRMAEKDIARMAGEYVDNMVIDFLSKEVKDRAKRKQIAGLLKFILNWYISLKVQQDIPEEYDLELQGIVDGCQKANRFSPVTKGRLWMLNVGFDCLMAVAYTGKFLGKDLSEVFRLEVDRESVMDEELHEARRELKSIPSRAITPVEPEELNIPLMCNGFSVFGDVVKGKNHYFGRDFMFSTGGVYQDTACMIIYNPKQEGSSLEDSFPFVSMTAPGIIGSIAIMNSRGVASGVDMVPGANSNPDRPGINSLLLLRHAVQHGASAKAAVRIMEKVQRGVSWNYIIADGFYDEACIVEAGASTDGKEIDFLRYPSPDLKRLLPEKGFLGINRSVRQLNGLMVRWSDFRYPRVYHERFNQKLFEAMNKTMDSTAFGETGYINQYNSNTNQVEHNCPEAFYFAPQREISDEVVVVSNHYILPEMRLCSMHPWTNRISSKMLDDIQWRYDELNKQITRALEGGKKIDYEKARELIDFLSPKRNFPKYYENNPRSEDGEIVINGSVSLCDLKNLTMESHYGYYCDEWVKINLARFMYV